MFTPSAKRERVDAPHDRNSNPKATVFNTPILTDRHDRYCTNCACVMDNAALEKFPGQRCGRCSHAVEYRGDADGLWRRCVRCDVFNRCTFKTCYMCGRPNQQAEVLEASQVIKSDEETVEKNVEPKDQDEDITDSQSENAS